MPRLHLSECESTQETAFELLKECGGDVLVSCDKQIGGRGRRDRSWFSADQCLALSFNLDPSSEPTLTALELAVLVRLFLQKELGVQTRLKWPNDLLLADGKKCGGILIQGRGGVLVAGIGLNIYHPQENIPPELASKMGMLFSRPQKLDHKSLCEALRTFILSNRLGAESIRKKWMEGCSHIDAQVRAVEDGKITRGIFKGIGKAGQALLKPESGDEELELYNATIELNP